MRQGLQDVGFIESVEGEVIGVNLGWDFAAEHEWGIRRITKDFGLLLEKDYGFESRKNTIVPEGLELYKGPKTTVLQYLLYRRGPLTKEKNISRELSIYGNNEISGAWSDLDFGARVIKKRSSVLEMLYSAFQENNGVILHGGKQEPFSNNGLLLLNYALIPEDWKEEARKTDREGREHTAHLKQLERESGVLEKLAQAGKKQYSDFNYLGVDKVDKEDNPLWWLNGGNGIFGIYSTHDIIDWIEGKGKAITDAEERKREREASHK